MDFIVRDDIQRVAGAHEPTGRTQVRRPPRLRRLDEVELAQLRHRHRIAGLNGRVLHTRSMSAHENDGKATAGLKPEPELMHNFAPGSPSLIGPASH